MIELNIFGWIIFFVLWAIYIGLILSFVFWGATEDIREEIRKVEKEMQDRTVGKITINKQYYTLYREVYRQGTTEGEYELVFSEDIKKVKLYLTNNFKKEIYEEIESGEVSWIITKDTEDEFMYLSPDKKWEYIHWISLKELNIL